MGRVGAISTNVAATRKKMHGDNSVSLGKENIRFNINIYWF
jgi:hypothetical protein